MITSPRVLAKITGDRQEWLSDRRRGIGSSDAPAVLGVSWWRSPYTVYLDKIGELPPREDTERMYWGRVLEDVVAQEFTKRTGKKVRRSNKILQHDEHDWMVCCLDREVVGESAILECKTTSEYNSHVWDKASLPVEYVVQVMHQLAVTGAELAYVACLIGCQRYEIREIPRDEELISTIIKEEQEFWCRVERREPPEVSHMDGDVLSTVYSDSVADSIQLPDDAERALRAYDAALDLERTARKDKQRAQNQLRLMLGENESGMIGDRKVTWKPNNKGSRTIRIS